MLPNKRVVIVLGDQETAQECYHDTLRIRRKKMDVTIILQLDA